MIDTRFRVNNILALVADVQAHAHELVDGATYLGIYHDRVAAAKAFGQVFHLGQQVAFENWLGGTWTRVQIVDLSPVSYEAAVIRAGSDEVFVLPLESLAITPDERLTYLPSDNQGLGAA